MHLRDFLPTDQDEARQLILSGLRDRWGDAFDPTYNWDLDDITAIYVDNGADVVVIDSGTSMIAIGMLVPDDATRARIVRMSVDASHRRRGFGTIIVGELVRRARARSLSEVVVLTDTAWHSATSLYRSCGFMTVRCDSVDTHFALRFD